MKQSIEKDKWAIKACEYLERKGYSSEEVVELMVKIGIKRAGEVNKNDKS